MRKVTLTFGLISGGIVSVLMVLSMSLWRAGTINFDNGELVGYASMLIALSMIFFGVKSFRDNYQNGSIRFGRAFQVGALIALIASSMYVVCWEVLYQTDEELKTTFMDKYAQHTINKMKEKGASAAEIEETTRGMAEMKQMYENPLIRIGMTLLEIAPVGLVIALISAAILRRRAVLPA